MRRSLLTTLFLLFSWILHAQVSDCPPPLSSAEIHINNLRYTISNGLQHFNVSSGAAFEISSDDPLQSTAHGIYADGIWMGGYSPDGQLKMAGVTYRAGGGNDFYAGPLSNNGMAATESNICDAYDDVYLTNKVDVLLHREYFDRLENGEPLNTPPFENGYTIPDYFYTWPATNNNSDFSYFLAPFYDRNQDQIYDPSEGDYPWYDLEGNVDCSGCATSTTYPLQGHQTAWYVSNDTGGPHTETGGEPIGLELQVMSYAFDDAGAIGDAAFTRYLAINRGSQTLLDFYFGKWVDPDLGCWEDDYVGCDVSRGMAYVYNGDGNDENCNGNSGFGENPPAVGIDIICGPMQDPDGVNNPLTIDLSIANAQNGILYAGIGNGYEDLSLDVNDPERDLIVDNEQLGMRKFMTYWRSDQTSTPNINGEPVTAIDYYRYMDGKWRNGSPMTYGGAGVAGSIITDYMYPANSDPLGWATNGTMIGDNWSEATEGASPGDRRFIMSSGKFTFDPGEVNVMTVGYYVGWPESPSGDAVLALQEAHDAVQVHFNSCFALIEDPVITALDEQEQLLVFSVFPNPATESVQINAGVNTFSDLRILDVSGEMISQTSGVFSSRTDVDVSNLTPGLYFLMIEMENGTVFKKLMIE